MFETDMKEAKEGKVTIQGFSYETVLTVIKFYYDFDLDENIKESEMVELLKFTDMYQFETLKVSSFWGIFVNKKTQNPENNSNSFFCLFCYC